MVKCRRVGRRNESRELLTRRVGRKGSWGKKKQEIEEKCLKFGMGVEFSYC